MEPLSRMTSLSVLHVEDDDATAQLLRRAVTQKHSAVNVYRVTSGDHVIPYLTRSEGFNEAAPPNLVLLDLNLPKKDGFQILGEIRRQPALEGLPVIVFSSSTREQDQARAFACGANAYIVKPYDLQGFFDAAEQIVTHLLASTEAQSAGRQREQKARFASESREHGTAVASYPVEARSRAITDIDRGDSRSALATSSGCAEGRRLLDAFAETVQELLHLHDDQFRAIIEDDADCNRFDLLIHMANEKKMLAKYAYLRHLESHGCSKADDVIDES